MMIPKWLKLVLHFLVRIMLPRKTNDDFKQAKAETVDKVCEIVRKQLALPAESEVTGESKFVSLGADSLDTVSYFYPFSFNVFLPDT